MLRLDRAALTLLALLTPLLVVEPALAAEASTDTEPAGEAAPPLEPSRRSTWDFELGGKLGYASDPIRGGTSPFGAAFGGRAGFAVGHVYFGVSVVDFLGSKDVDVTDTALLYGAELGVNARLVEVGAASLTLRPLVGAGGLTVFRTDPSTSAASTSTSSGRRGRADVVSSASGGARGNVTTVDAFYVEPGLTLMFASGIFFVGLNGNLLVVPSIAYSGAAPATWVSYGTQGQTGLRF